MVSFSHKIRNEAGLHARPAGLLVKEVEKLSSAVTIEKEGRRGDAKRIFALMSLSAKQNDEITVILEGEKEEEEARRLRAFFEENI